MEGSARRVRNPGGSGVRHARSSGKGSARHRGGGCGHGGRRVLPLRIAVVIGHAPSLRLDRPSVVDIPLRLHRRILDALAHHLDHRRLGSVEHLVGAHAETVVQSGVTPLVHRRPLFRWHAVAFLAENRALFPVAQRRSSLEPVYTEARARRASGSSSDRACGRRLRLREAGAAPACPSGRGPSRKCVRGTCGRSRHGR